MVQNSTVVTATNRKESVNMGVGPHYDNNTTGMNPC